MNYFKAILSFVCASVLCVPLIIVICQGEERQYNIDNTTDEPGKVFGNACLDGDLEKCIAARDSSLRSNDYENAFKYLANLCERFKDSNSCYLTYQTFFSIQSNAALKNRKSNITLYEVLYYLDIGCKLNNYDSCMVAAKIYENGIKPGAAQAFFGYNINYDPQEAKRYYKRVCESVSDKAYDACYKVVELSETQQSSLLKN
ncbi:MAG: hypothetical protein II340_08000 [Succinivibrio sp.]|nr:hypothetical protein [Succinivibrio sp.]